MLHMIFALQLWVWISYTEKTILSECLKFLHYVDWALCVEVCDDCVCFSRCVVMVWDASPDSLWSLRICRGTKGNLWFWVYFVLIIFLLKQLLPDYCLVKQYSNALFFTFLFFSSVRVHVASLVCENLNSNTVFQLLNTWPKYDWPCLFLHISTVSLYIQVPV